MWDTTAWPDQTLHMVYGASRCSDLVLRLIHFDVGRGDFVDLATIDRTWRYPILVLLLRLVLFEGR